MKLSTLNNINPDFLLALAKANDEYKAQTGEEINFTSGHRTHKRQKQIFATARPGYAAHPGHSLHESDESGNANAVDVDPNQVEKVARTGVLDKFGLYRPLLNNPKAPENWHVEFIAGPRGGKSIGGGNIPITQMVQTQEQTQPQGESIPFDQGGKSYMDSSMLAKGGFGLPSIPNTDTSDLAAGISAGKNTPTGFLGQILAALGAGGGESSEDPGGLGGMIGGAVGGPAGAVAGAGLGQLGGDIVKMLMLNKINKMAGEHAGWLQQVAANPPRPGWAKSMSGPGMNS
jgi:hypothetical protein